MKERNESRSGAKLEKSPPSFLGHLSYSIPPKAAPPSIYYHCPVLCSLSTYIYTSFSLFLGPGFEKSRLWLSLPFFTMSCLVLYAFFPTNCSYRTPPTMGKDQNANGGLVCAHPAFGIIYYHRPLPTFDLFLLLPARHLASRLGRDSRNPDPGFLSLFSQELLLRGGARKFCSSWKCLLLSLALWFSTPSSPFLAP